ncbi:MAG: DUF350 domain-containing protein [Verrucomicrobia bacterium]|jgi:uncharacterized membrane protein YjfL (UPF0719 family)|nr:DUF350 domain-containing protein [Verrucomicrobiota bacterium]
MDVSILSSVLNQLVRVLPLLLVALILLWVAMLVLRLSLPLDFKLQLSQKGNPAYGVLCAGFLFGAALAISGSFFGRWEDSSLLASGKTLIEGCLSIFLIRIGIWINDRTILSGFCISKEISEDRNLGVGLVVAGSAIACGLIINGSLIGYSAGFWLGIRDIILFWILGQASLIVGSRVFRGLKQFDVHRLLEYDGNVAVGLSFGAFLIGVGIIVRGALIGSGLISVSNEILRMLILSTMGVGILAVLHASIGRCMLGGVNLVEEVEMNHNTAVGSVVAAVTIGVALLIAELFKR